MQVEDHWVGMPEFVQEKQSPFCMIRIYVGDHQIINCRFGTYEDFQKFLELIGSPEPVKTCRFEELDKAISTLGQKLTHKTKSIWYPARSHWGGVKHRYISNKPIQNRYPVYIVSKGRASNGLTWKALNVMGIPYKIVVEESELSKYASEVGEEKCLVLPQDYLDSYDTCDDLGSTKSKGPGAARNFAMDHATSLGVKRHWVLDDNLDAFHYLNRNEKFEVECASTFAAAEDFVDRYTNVPVSGMNYYSFCKKTDRVPPLKFNTRIYSCLLIDNHAGYRWKGRYNEDTDLSLRVLKDGLCTIQFNTFLCGKVTTQRMKGGNSKEFYDKEGTMAKSKMLEEMHPDVAKVVWRFNRWHHHVDYRGYEHNKPLLNCDLTTFPLIDDYGLEKVAR